MEQNARRHASLTLPPTLLHDLPHPSISWTSVPRVRSKTPPSSPSPNLHEICTGSRCGQAAAKLALVRAKLAYIAQQLGGPINSAAEVANATAELALHIVALLAYADSLDGGGPESHAAARLLSNAVKTIQGGGSKKKRHKSGRKGTRKSRRKGIRKSRRR